MTPSTVGFPPVEWALQDPNGLLAVGGDLSPARIIAAYRSGIFPWYSADQPILWWSPDPRAVLFPPELHVSRSLRRSIGRAPYRISLDTAFAAVMTGCAGPRAGSPSTWITAEMHTAYCALHARGIAHSVEAWQGETLVGGLYGLAIGRIFFGESMFSRATDASKIAFVHLVRQLQRWGYSLIDCQVASTHLASLGAREIPRRDFCARLQHDCASAGHPLPWRFDADFDPLHAP